MSEDFYCKYYIGHRGRFGHEYMEFELYSDGRLRYANNSNYKNDSMIRKEAYVGPAVIAEVLQLEAHGSIHTTRHDTVTLCCYIIEFLVGMIYDVFV